MPNTIPEVPVLKVSVGVLRDSRGQVLVARRPAGSSFAGCWEFPGGKLQEGESGRQALARELLEELEVMVLKASWLGCWPRHEYEDFAVILEAWQVFGWQGRPTPRQGQELRWQPRQALAKLSFPAANAGLIKMLSSMPTDTEPGVSALAP